MQMKARIKGHFHKIWNHNRIYPVFFFKLLISFPSSLRKLSKMCQPELKIMGKSIYKIEKIHFQTHEAIIIIVNMQQSHQTFIYRKLDSIRWNISIVYESVIVCAVNKYISKWNWNIKQIFAYRFSHTSAISRYHK